eukprot:5721379-Prymnesium_polylepis.1
MRYGRRVCQLLRAWTPVLDHYCLYTALRRSRRLSVQGTSPPDPPPVTIATRPCLVHLPRPLSAPTPFGAAAERRPPLRSSPIARQARPTSPRSLEAC